MVSVLIVNDQSLQRVGLRMLLTVEPDLSVVGEAASGAEAVAMSAALRPDVVLMDIRLAETDDIESIRRIARPPRPVPATGSVLAGGPPPRVLALTSTRHEGHAYAALRAGACGFLLTDAAPGELIAAVRVVAAGDAVITPALTRALIDTVRDEQPASLPLRREVGLDTLTERERDVLTAVAAGWSNTEIAVRLSIAPTTVKSHVSHILAKIGARARVQAVAFAYESGLIQPAA
ncbi:MULTISPECIES: response regulator transcription factor [unclassified Streptomyces]|uniref:LuxR C-terminal-related transcriptional regulator n=1 Tax=unclassified Streptomyces TaxID=2593676 RepID=UPI002252CAF3|nr:MULTISPECIES: response regulator transcription factor [unclassified Streptomyces]MCX4878736.1 response regulator transcription factor [Streptomyces sp. NBC_00847]MCX5418698.1 response regulator transcription factor [Streptomyces sp. NBC_00078]